MKLHYFELGEHIVLIMQKQPPEVLYKKDFQVCNFIKKRLQHRYFPVNIAVFKMTCFEEHLYMAAASNYGNMYGYIIEKICRTEFNKSTILSRVSLLF